MLSHYYENDDVKNENADAYEYYYFNLQKDIIDLEKCRDDIFQFNENTPLEKIRSWYKITCANGDNYFGNDVAGDFPWVKDIEKCDFDEYFDKFISGMQMAVDKMAYKWNQIVNSQ